MIWVLLIITAAGSQQSGTFDSYDQCNRTAQDLRIQGVKAVCTQQESPEKVVARMQQMMISMIKEVDKIK